MSTRILTKSFYFKDCDSYCSIRRRVYFLNPYSLNIRKLLGLILEYHTVASLFSLTTKQIKITLGGKAFFSRGTNHSKGLIILLNPFVDFKVEKLISDKQGRVIILKVSFDEKTIVLVNIYAPNDVVQQVNFFQKLNKQLEEFAQDTIIIGGDFNCALTSKDKSGGNPVSIKSAVIKEINTLCDSYNLDDLWRNLNPDKQSFTWRTKSFKIQCRLDYFFVSQELIQSAKKCDIVHAPESGHSAAFFVLQTDHQKQKRGPGFWKFNTALLKDEKCIMISAIKLNIPIFKRKYEETQDLGLK